MPGYSIYAWTITEDKIEDGLHVGTTGPSNSSMPIDEIKAQGVKFRMLDDDGNWYYTGYWFEGSAGLGVDGDPLMDFGMPNAGCTQLDIWKDGAWDPCIA